MATTTRLLFCRLIQAAIPVLAWGCQKTPSEPVFQLTPATQTGANTLSFRVDERVWQPFGRRCYGYGGGACDEQPMTAYYNPRRGQFQLQAMLTTAGRAEDFALECDSLFAVGLFRLPPLGSSYRGRSGGLFFAQAQQAGDPTYDSLDPARTTITITRLDTTNRIIAGTFSGYLQSSLAPVQAVTLTEGRFDVRY